MWQRKKGKKKEDSAYTWVYTPLEDGLQVSLEGKAEGGRVNVARWSALEGAPGYARATWLGFLDAEEAVLFEDGQGLKADWQAVSRLASDRLTSLDLPPFTSTTLEVTCDAALADANFLPRYGFFKDGRRVPSAKRTGAWFQIPGLAPELLPEPVYLLCQAIDAFDPRWNLDEKLRWWGQTRPYLPADATVDDYLGSMNVACASAFTINPLPVEDADFDPVAGVWKENDDGDRTFERLLPAAQAKAFADGFRKFSGAQDRYVLEPGFYLVLAPDVKQALQATRKVQKGSREERLAFLDNPAAVVRSALDRTADRETPPVAVDDVFSDEGLSERVLGVGAWEPPQLDWYEKRKELWFAEGRLPVRAGRRTLFLKPQELRDLCQDVLKAREEGKSSVPLPDETEEPLEITEEVISELQKASENTPPVEKPQPAPEAEEDVEEKTDDVEEDLPQKQVLQILDNVEALQYVRERKTRPTGLKGLCPNLKSSLLPHQEACLDWLQAHWEAGNWGALLADDMGLGKTLESLSFLASLKAHGSSPEPFLIVAPTGLLANWKEEHDRHLSDNGLGRPALAYGTGLRTLRLDNAVAGNELSDEGTTFAKLDVDALRAADWVLTTYETLRDYQHSFAKVKFQVGVFDESQKIKNPQALVTAAVLAMNLDFAILMTGTPVENRPADVWPLLDRAEPGTFGTLKEFSKEYENKEEESLSLLNHRLRMSDGGPSLMLRRLKKDYLAGMPEKHVERREVPMPDVQVEAYETCLRQAAGGLPALEALQRLRATSLAPHRFDGKETAGDYVRKSARLTETFNILEHVQKKGEKALVFVEFREMQDFLHVALCEHFGLTRDILAIHGSVSGQKRQQRVGEFQARPGFDVMLLSPKAGGVGLTLTAANHVIHLTRWWNPAVEDQCTDRVYRIGQKRDVRVWLPIAVHPERKKSSFDLCLDRLLERKRQMNQDVLAPPAGSEDDANELYEGIIGPRPGTDTADDLDTMEPEAFEAWTLRKLAVLGYDTKITPITNDKGADGVARKPDGTTILIQCKRLAESSICGKDAVEEILNAVPHYTKAPEKPRLAVVTTAARFSDGARQLAHQNGVCLIDRGNLERFPEQLEQAAR